MNFGMKGRGVLTAAAFVAGALALSACGSSSDTSASGSATGGGNVEISFLVDNSDVTMATSKAVADAFMKANPTIKVTIDTRPQGADGDNAVKTKLSTGDMSDVFWYNSGSLLQALDPSKNLVDLTGESWQGNVDQGFKDAASFDGKVYAAPIGTATGGGVLYNLSLIHI